MKLWKNGTRSDRMLLGWAIVCLALSLLLLGVKDHQLRASAAEDEDFFRFVDVAAEIYKEVRGKYVDPVESRELLEGALSGMFSRLDEHSVYLDPRTLKSLNKDTGGEFSGIGIHITMRQGLLTVIAPIPGSPSAKIGLAPWDRIIEIEGETTEGMTLTEAVDKLTGPSGTQVTIKVYREGETEPLDFTITRAQIKIESVYHRMMDDGIGYLRIARFSDRTTSDMRKALLDMKAQGMQSLILDLRFNTGGLLREAIDVANLFVPKHQVIVATKGRLRSSNREYRASEDPMFTDLPLFVLVNEGSASASEIVAGALQDHKMAVIIGPSGKNTFGKGSVQTIEQLHHTLYDDDSGNAMDSAIKLTTARYYTPSGRTIHQVGITPDIGVPLPKDHERELLRRGLYGDTTIPMTREERELQERLELQNEEIEDLEHGIRLQREEERPREESPDPDPEEATEGTEGAQPFYANARRPEFVDDGEFRDIMLDEALKLMKVYNILGTRGDKDRPAIADLINESLSLAK